MARAPRELDSAQLTKVISILKKLPEDTSDAQKFDAIQAAVKPQVARSMAAKLMYAAEVEMDPKLRIKRLDATSYQAARKRGLRDERISAYSGVSMAEVKALVAESGIDKGYIGRGRRYDMDGEAPSKAAAKKAAAGTEPKRGPGRPRKDGTPAQSKQQKVRRRQDLSTRP